MSFDAAAIDKISETVMPATVQSLVALFLEELAERRSTVSRAAGNQDLPTLAHEAHALKSSAGTYGAPQLRQASLTLEQACQTGGQPQAAAAAQSLVGAIDRTAAAVRDWLERSQDRSLTQ